MSSCLCFDLSEGTANVETFRYENTLAINDGFDGSAVPFASPSEIMLLIFLCFKKFFAIP